MVLIRNRLTAFASTARSFHSPATVCGSDPPGGSVRNVGQPFCKLVAIAAEVAIDRTVDHLDPADVGVGDVIIGTLPVHLAAEVWKRGARYLHLSLDLPEEKRGLELSVDDMARLGARLQEYRVETAP